MAIDWKNVYVRGTPATMGSGGTPGTAGTETQVLEFYKSFGEWARHYSTVRMTIATFFVTIAFTILHLRWEKPELLLALSSAGVCLIGVVTFLFFSAATFKRMTDQISILDAFLVKNNHPPTNETYNFKSEWSGWPLALLFLVIFGTIDVCWYTGIFTEKGNPQSVREVKVPIVFQSGTSTARIEVPFTVSVENVSPPGGGVARRWKEARQKKTD